MLSKLQANFLFDLNPLAKELYNVLVRLYHNYGWELITASKNTHFVASGTKEPAENKIVLSVWLEELFFVMVQDLEAYSIWKQEHQSKAAVLYSSMDWYYRGLLAERIGLVNFAEFAFKNSVGRAFNMKSLLRLLNIITKQHAPLATIMTEDDSINLHNTLVIVDKLIEFYLDGLDEIKDTKEQLFQVHPIVTQSFRRLICRYGLQSMRAQITNLKRKKLITEMMLDAVGWNCVGFDR